MPDEPTAQPTWERILDKVMKWAAPILLAYISLLATRNTVKVDQVEQKQVEAAEATQTVKTTLDVKTSVDEKKATDDVEIQRTLLYGNWKYLDENAYLPQERQKATEAKKTFDEFEKKNPKKK